MTAPAIPIPPDRPGVPEPIASHPFRFTATDNPRSTTLLEAEYTVAQFYAELVHTVGTKDGEAFVPARLRSYDNGRRQDLVEAMTALVLDFDHVAPIQVEGALTRLQSFALAYTTHSHTPAEPRFRLVVLFTREVTPAEFRRLWVWACDRFDGLVDPSCKDLARVYYRPRVPTNEAAAHAWVRIINGPLLDPDEILRELPPATDRSPPTSSTARGPFADDPLRSSEALEYGIDLLDLTLGNNGKVQCPNHADPAKHKNGDAHPSAHIYPDHLYCFTCRQHFDPIDLVALAHGCTKAEASEQLRSATCPMTPPSQEPLPNFPVDALPTLIGCMVADVAESVQIAPDVPGMVALSMMGAVASMGASVQVGDTHVEVLSIWTVTVLRSGERKSAAQTVMIKPLRDWEEERTVGYAVAFREAVAMHEVHDRRMKVLKERAATATEPTARQTATTALREEIAHAPELPPSPELTVQDTTPEALVQRLSRQGGRAFLVSDEGGPFDNVRGRYAKQGSGPNMDVYLQAHAGTDIKVDRVGRPPDWVRSPTLCMSLVVQPVVIADVLADPRMRGAGFIARILFSTPPSRVGSRFYKNYAIDPDVAREYATQIRSVSNRMHGLGKQGKSRLVIQGNALTAWAAFHDRIERQLGPGGRLSRICDWASKVAGAVARIAGAMHVFSVQPDGTLDAQISAETIAAAIRIGHYLVEHALHVLDRQRPDQPETPTESLVRWIEGRTEPEFSLRDATQARRTLSESSIRSAIDELVTAGRLRPIEPEATGKPGRPPGPRWAIVTGEQSANNDAPAPRTPDTTAIPGPEPQAPKSIFSPTESAERFRRQREAVESRHDRRGQHRVARGGLGDHFRSKGNQ